MDDEEGDAGWLELEWFKETITVKEKLTTKKLMRQSFAGLRGTFSELVLSEKKKGEKVVSGADLLDKADSMSIASSMHQVTRRRQTPCA